MQPSTQKEAPEPSGSFVVQVDDAWYPAMPTRELRDRPVPIKLYGTPLVVFRDASGSPRTLLDRCPHRNAPLSLGRVQRGELECAYHGWRFDGEGKCRAVPGLCREPENKGRQALAYPTLEQDGFVWIYGNPERMPEREPYRLPFLDDARYRHISATLDMKGSLHATAENALDVPHTSFLHQGLFRKAEFSNEIEVVVRSWHDRVEAEYIGEPRPSGLMGRLLAPGGGVVRHFDRFLLPCVAQVEYGLGEKTHVVATTLLTPIDAYHTRLFAVVSFRIGIPLPGWLVSLIVKPIAMKVLRQDAAMLKEQTATIHHFGKEEYASTEIDALGPQILRLLRSAQRGEQEPETEPKIRRYTLRC